MWKRKRKIIQWLAKLGVSALFVYVANRSLERHDFGIIAGSMHLFPLLAVVVLAVARLALQAWRWSLILREAEVAAKGTDVLRTLLWGHTLAFVSPARLAEVLRGLELDPSRKLDTVDAAIVDKLCIIYATSVFGAAALLLSTGDGSTGGVRFERLLTAGTALAAVAGTYLITRGKGTKGGKRKSGFRSQVRAISGIMPRIHSVGGRRIVGISLFAHSLLLLQSAVLFAMLGGTGLLEGIAAAAKAFALMVFFPFTVANMGIREFAFALFLGGQKGGVLAGVLRRTCLGASLTILVVNIALPALAGLVWEWVEGRKRAN